MFQFKDAAVAKLIMGENGYYEFPQQGATFTAQEVKAIIDTEREALIRVVTNRNWWMRHGGEIGNVSYEWVCDEIVEQIRARGTKGGE